MYSFFHSLFQCNEILKIVREVLDTTDDKIIIVSQWTSMLEIIATFFYEERIGFCELTGKTKINDRNDIVESFNTKSHTRVRGISTNFQVVLFDVKYNWYSSNSR